MHGAVVNPLPPEIVARWSATWGAGVHPSRPWWRWRHVSGVTLSMWPPIEPVAWFRGDGKRGPDTTAQAGRLESECTDMLEAIDTTHPLPAPMPLPMQVWRWAEGDETMIVRVVPDGRVGVPDTWRVWTGLNNVSALVSPRAKEFVGGSRVEQWPPPGAILVAGPSPHGFNVPWSGS